MAITLILDAITRRWLNTLLKESRHLWYVNLVNITILMKKTQIRFAQPRFLT